MSEIDDLKKMLEELKSIVAESQQALAPIQEQKANLDKESQDAYNAYLAVQAKVTREKRELDEKAYDFQTKLNRAKQEIQAKQFQLTEAEKEAAKAEAQAKMEAELLALNERWDRLTLAAPWREFAKDHQIAAGHKITQDRKVILADPMGLGKTLSSIIACDISEAATRLTSPNFPFLGEDKEVWVPTQWERISDGYRKGWISQEDKDSNEWVEVPGHYENKIVNSVTRPVGKRILYFCPSPLLKNVEREFRMWSKHRSVLWIGGIPKMARQFAFDAIKEHPEFVVICNYEAWRRDKELLEQLISFNFDTVIIDEAHNIKNMKSGAYKGIKKIIDDSNPEYIIPMTGTPILNRPQELFSLLTLVNPERFHTLNDFLWDFCEQDPDTGYWKFKPGGIDRISKQISKNFLRRTREQAGIKLPEKTIIEHDLTPDTEAYPLQAKVREQMRKYASIIVDEAKGQTIAAAVKITMFLRLRQIETWPAGIVMKDKHGNVKFSVDVEESQKMDYIISKEPDEQGDFTGLIPEAIADERMVLFSQFKPPLREIKRRVEALGYRAIILDGDTPEAIRDEVAMDFDRKHTPNREDSKWDIALCNYRVGGVGLNLTAATQMIILDEEWNPGKRDQAYDRLHRMGQTQPITIHVIRNKGTIDDWLAHIMESKEGVVEGFNSKMEDLSLEGFLNWEGNSDTGGLA